MKAFKKTGLKTLYIFNRQFIDFPSIQRMMEHIFRRLIYVKEKFIRFMYGRYGMDSLGKFTIIAGLIAMILAGWNNNLILSLVSWA